MYRLAQVIKLVLTVLIVLFGLSLYKTSKADDAIILCCSYHIDRSAGYNEFNPGFIYRHFLDNPHSYAFGGAYYNSLSKTTVIGGFGVQGKRTGPVTGALSVGLATGYSSTPEIVIVPSLVLKNNIVLNFITDPADFKRSTAIGLGYLLEW